MRIRSQHSWALSIPEAKSVQERLRRNVTPRGTPRSVRLIAGADLSYHRFSSHAVAGVVVLSWPDLSLQETVTVEGEMEFPYVPGYLSFREGPLLIQAFRKLQSDPDLIFFDGQGIAHPRGFGLACHMGVYLDRPSLGCAKSILFGNMTEPDREAGSRTLLEDARGRPIGVTLRTRTGVKPVFISPGHRIGLLSAAAWALKATRGYRVPEPTRQAHLLVNQTRREGAHRRT